MSVSETLPRIHLIAEEAERLGRIAEGIGRSEPNAAGLLLAEIDRAQLWSPDALPPNTVSMGATVEFIDEGNGARHTLQLVYPNEADIAAGRISVLTPVGAGLIGMRAGRSITWPDGKGRDRQLRIVRVTKPFEPENAISRTTRDGAALEV